MSQNHRKQAARCGTSALALVMGLSLAVSAHAQSFQAEGQVVNGAAFLGGTATTTTVVVQTPQVVIDWTPFDTAGTGTINFQPAATTATFSADSIVLGDYTVLNRIVPIDNGGLVANRAVQFNGTVQSIGPNGPGGNIWFYSPTGIIAGATSAFNVGSLILTTNPIDTTQGLYGPAGEIRFRGVPGSTGFVNVLNGAQLNAQQANSGYVGIVSANISQGGDVTVNGGAAYVAAEQVDVTFEAGLVNIQISQGTTDANGIVHTGSTTGAQSGGAADRQTIAMVAVPKNTALTMLLSGTIGYTPAEEATNDGSAIVLSAGQGLGFDSVPAVPAALGNIRIGSGDFTSQLFATATDTITVAPAAGSATEFETLASLKARRAITLTAAPGSQIIANGDIEGQSLIATSGFGANGGAISLIAQSGGGLAAGGITAAAALQLDASVSSAAATGSALASGGTITINAQGGTITAPQISADVVAVGRGGGAGQPGGNAQAGTINVFASAGGSIATNQLFANARGVGGQSDDGNGPGVGGNGTGGAINVAAVGGTITLQAPLQLDAGGDGGGGRLLGGNGTGGAIDLRTGGGGAITAPGTSVLTTSAGGGASPVVAGNGAGGSIAVTDNLGLLAFQDLVLGSGGFGGSSPATSGAGGGGRVAVTLQGQTQNWNSLTIDASSYGGLSFVTGSLSGGAAPRAGIASGAFLTVAGTGALNIAGDLQLDANAIVGQNVAAGTTATAGQAGITVSGGGALNVGGVLAARALTVFSEELPLGIPAITPVMQGGQASILATGGTIQAAGIFVNTSAFGAGSTTTAGSATGGSSLLRAAAGGTIRSVSAASGAGGAIRVDADGYGATGPSPSTALGGRAELSAADGTITGGTAVVSASALASSDSFDLAGTGFAGTAGTALVTGGGAAGTAVLGFTDLTVMADGDPSGGGFLVNGNGGAGTGGNASLQIASGNYTATATTVRANGRGGFSGLSTGAALFTSGSGQGGIATVDAAGGTAAAGTLTIAAQGIGGGAANALGAAGGTPSPAGAGTGGTATFQASSGTLSAATLSILATGIGGAGMNAAGGGAGGSGGNGTGGTARWTSAAGGNSLVTIPGLVIVEAEGRGQAGGAVNGTINGNSGAGTGGSALFDLASGRFNLGSTSLSSNGLGGAGPAAGNGTGGTARFALTDASAAVTPRTLASLALSANGIGGSAAATSTAGTTGLTAQVGGAGAALGITGNFAATANGTTAPAGNGFTGAFGGAPLTVGGSSNIQTTRDVAITLAAPGAFATQGTLTIATPRTITSSGTGLISSGGASSITGTLGVALANLQSGGTTLLAADNGALSVTALTSTGLVTARGRSVNIASPAGLSFADADATAGDLIVTAAGPLVFTTADATGAVTLNSTGGSLTATGAVNGAAVTLTASGNVTTNANVTSAGALAVTAGGSFLLNGAATGTAIRAESADIAFGTGGRLGTRGVTGTVSLINAAPANRTQIGGTAQTGAYSLDAGEASRIFADQGIDVSLRAAGIPAAGPGEVTLGDLALTYGANGNIGTGGFLRIATPGTARTTGAVLLTTSGDNDVFGITARRLEIVTNTGRIALRNGAGVSTGRFNATADVVAVADSTALAAIDGVTDTRALTALLDQPGTSTNPEASLQAGTINLTVANRLLVQNSGATTEYADRRGFSANQLAITTGSASTVISINGQTFDAAGVASQGLDTVDTLLINGVRPVAGGSFDAFSTVNGCVIGQSCRFTLSTVPSLRRDEIDETLNMPNPPPAFLTTIELAEEADEPLKPLIDEPVTGVGNDDLWLRDCNPDDKLCTQANPAP